jgi:predicted MarR family transcription regulator
MHSVAGVKKRHFFEALKPAISKVETAFSSIYAAFHRGNMLHTLTAFAIFGKSQVTATGF